MILTSIVLFSCKNENRLTKVSQWNLMLLDKEGNKGNSLLMLIADEANITGYCITSIGTNQLTGTIINGRIDLYIPDIFGNNICLELKGKMINNELIEGTGMAYVCDKTNYTKYELDKLKDFIPDMPFSATKK